MGNLAVDGNGVVFDKIINSLDDINILTNLHLLTVQACKRKSTHGRCIKFLLDFGVYILHTVGNLERTLDIQIHPHNMIGVMRLDVIVLNVMLDRCTMAHKHTGSKAIAKVNARHSLILQLIFVCVKVFNLDGDIIDRNRIFMLWVGVAAKCLSKARVGCKIDIASTRLQ